MKEQLKQKLIAQIRKFYEIILGNREMELSMEQSFMLFHAYEIADGLVGTIIEGSPECILEIAFDILEGNLPNLSGILFDELIDSIISDIDLTNHDIGYYTFDDLMESYSDFYINFRDN